MSDFESLSHNTAHEYKKEDSIEETKPAIEQKESVSLPTLQERGEKAERASFISILCEKAKDHPAVVSFITVAAVATIGLVSSMKQTGEHQKPVDATLVSGEQENGVSYDYSHYLDYENKISRNAYDYSLADAYGDREKTQDAIMDVATRNPEALASYAYAILDDSEKKELGLEGMNMAQIDDAISNGENGGALQKKILDKLNSVLGSEDTKFEFYKENDFETTSYVYFVDDNKDGIASPSEMHLAYSKSKRQGAPQLDILRKAKTTNGETVWHKAADLNMNCGGQINSDESFPGLPEIDENSTPTNPSTPNTPKKEWGKSGDPHGGSDVEKSDKVNPKSEVSKEQNDNTNKGNQGYVDDVKAKPGQSSGNTSNNDRKSGGENQGGDKTNGENAYQDQQKIEEGKKKDEAGNATQQAAQESGGENGSGATAGGDNYSDSAEEEAVKNGDF